MRNEKKQNRTFLLRGASALVTAAVAMTGATAGAQEGEDDDVIVVTGSRIPQPNLSSVSPIQVVGQQELSFRGTTDVVDMLNTLPQVVQNAGSSFSNTTNPLATPGGLTTVDLRGIGQQRTLVLVNSRRLGVGDPNTGNPNSSADIDQIPSLMVERIEVITGGASATYGSDALAGVVNFIMRDDFEGAEFDVQYSFNQHTNDDGFMRGLSDVPLSPGEVEDGYTRSAAFLIGVNAEDGRGNVTAYGMYRQADPVSQASRDFSHCKLNVRAATVRCGSLTGSPNSNFFQPGGVGTIYSVVGDQFVDQNDPAALNASPPVFFNSNQFSFLSRQDERYMAGFFAHYDVNEHATLYAEFGFMNDDTDVEIAPSGLFVGGALTPDANYRVNCGSPLLSAQQRGVMGCSAADITGNVTKSIAIGRRNIEGGGRHQSYEHNNYRGVIGLRGDLSDGWAYDVYGSYYYTSLFQTNERYLSLSRINRALDVVDADPGVGVDPQCRSAVDGSDPSCVPYNIFRDGGVTQDALNYLYQPGTAYGTTSEQIVQANLTGDLGSMGGRMPLAQDAIQVAFGLEYRANDFNFDPDAAELSGDLSGFGGAAGMVHDGFDVFELYGETRIPIVQDQAGFHELSVEAGYRYSDYSTAAGTIDTYKFGINWSPVEDLRFRGSFQHASRAPAATELFNPALLNLTTQLSSDPCATHAATLAQCLNTRGALSVADFTNLYNNNLIQDCPAGQCGALTGGNTDLIAETADTYSVGFTLTPSALPGFTASIDYYNIKLEDVIGSISANDIMNQCLATGSATFCNLLSRSPTGNIWGLGFVDLRIVNIASGTTSGVDVQASYRWDAGDIGSLSFALAGAWLEESSSQGNPVLPVVDCVGLYGANCGNTINPEWRHNLRFTWDTPWNVTGSLNWRYLGSVERDGPQVNPNFDESLDSVSYFDLSGTWDMTEALTLRVGANNLLDKDPPLISSLIAGTGSPNSYPSYDLLGRVVFVGLKARF